MRILTDIQKGMGGGGGGERKRRDDTKYTLLVVCCCTVGYVAQATGGVVD